MPKQDMKPKNAKKRGIKYVLRKILYYIAYPANSPLTEKDLYELYDIINEEL